MLIKLETFMSLNILKKDCYSGGIRGMRYMIEKQGECILVTIWPEPLCYSKAPEEIKQKKEFPFSEEGREQAAEWLNSQYQEQKPLWKNTFITALK